jgi:phage gp46-like protein
MPDITTFWNVAEGHGDWRVANPDGDPLYAGDDDLLRDDSNGGMTTETPLDFAPGLVAGRDLQTAVLISLFTDRLAGPDDVIPDGSGDPRGWWGDLGQPYPIGSKIWLRLRAKQTQATLQLVQGDIIEALDWMIQDQVVARVDVVTQWLRPGVLAATVTLTQATGTVQALQYSWAWKDLD